MSPLRMLYLALAVWGAVHPLLWSWHYMQTTGAGPGGVIDAWYANATTVGLTWDLTIAAIALSVWALAETWVRRNWSALWAIPAAFIFGIGCGLPLYLFLRTRGMD